MNYRDEAVSFTCDGIHLPGIISSPVAHSQDIGVLIVVGGPQYRVGSHRQFVLLARELASHGFTTMRFDYRGMGDADGNFLGFESIDQDIRAAMDTFASSCPGVTRFVLWGLCDAATASAFYAHSDGRVAGMVLLNPWVRSDAGEAETYLKHYYLQRVFSLPFWRKLFSGGVDLRDALTGLTRQIDRVIGRQSSRCEGQSAGAMLDLPTRMVRDLRRTDVPVMLILSGRDYVAREFENAVARGGMWKDLPWVREACHLEEADHTFSSAEHRARVAHVTLDWLTTL